jgi:hypothetical protein
VIGLRSGRSEFVSWQRHGFFLPPTPTPPLGLILPLSVYLGYLQGVSWPERSAYDLSPSRIQVTNACLVPREVEVVVQTQVHIYLTVSLNLLAPEFDI